MTPEVVASWNRVVRDIVAEAAAIFLFIFGPTHVHDPTALGIVLGTGVTLLGTPMFLRLDSRRRDDEGGKEP